MRLKSARVNWMLGWGNDPHLEIEVDQLPPQEKLRYEKKGPLYFAEKDGYASFFHWKGPGNEKGFGGSTYDITLKDGTKVALLGPWSSNSMAMNEAGFTLTLLCTIKEKYNYGGHITILYAEAAIELFNLGIELYTTDGFEFVPALPGMTPQESKDFLRKESK